MPRLVPISCHGTFSAYVFSLPGAGTKALRASAAEIPQKRRAVRSMDPAGARTASSRALSAPLALASGWRATGALRGQGAGVTNDVSDKVTPGASQGPSRNLEQASGIEQVNPSGSEDAFLVGVAREFHPRPPPSRRDHEADRNRLSAAWFVGRQRLSEVDNRERWRDAYARTCSNGSLTSWLVPSIALHWSGIRASGGPGGTQTPNQSVMSALL